MNNININTIREIRETNPQVIEFLEVAKHMTEKQKDLLIEIMDLCEGRPDRQEYALNYTGRIADLPAALVQI